MPGDFNDDFNDDFGVEVTPPTGAESGCCGPFMYGIPAEPPPGSGTVCASIISCCPMCPPDCCTEVILVYNCTNTADVATMDMTKGVYVGGAWGSIDFQEKLPQINYENSGDVKPLAQELPKFNHEIIKQSGFVFALGASVPCDEIISVTLTVISCCGVVNSNLISIVGDAIINGVPPSITDCSCNGLTLDYDIGTTLPVQLSDGAVIDASVIRMYDSSGECECDLISIEDPCFYPGAFRIQKVYPGGLDINVNQNRLKRSTKIMKQKKIRARHKKLMRNLRARNKT